MGVCVLGLEENGGESRKEVNGRKRVPKARTGAYPYYEITDTQQINPSMTAAISLRQISFSRPFSQVHKENYKYQKLFNG